MSFIRNAIAAIAREVRLRRDMRRLEGLDETMLSDIGISRGEIGFAVRCGRPRPGYSGFESFT